MKDLKFIHITKTGGTSIEDAALEKGIEWGRFDTEYTKDIQPNWHKPFSLIEDKDLKEKYDWFTVVRDPYSRIVSEFYCQWTQPLDKDVSVEKYNEIVRHNILNRHSAELGFHYCEQYLYLDDTSTIHILKFENLNDEFKQLMERYNIDVRLCRKNVGDKRYSSTDFDGDTVELINSIYHQDFVRFGYSKTNW